MSLDESKLNEICLNSRLLSSKLKRPAETEIILCKERLGFSSIYKIKYVGDCEICIANTVISALLSSPKVIINTEKMYKCSYRNKKI